MFTDKRYFPVLVLFVLLLMTGASFAATSIPFTVNMSEAVDVVTTGGTPRIAIDVDGNTRYATYASGTGTSALTFNYDMVAGDLDLDGVTLTSPIDLNGGTIKDLNGNNATLTFTVPNTSNVKVNYPSLSMDFTTDRYTLSGTVYNSLSSFLSAAGGTFSRASTATYFDSSGVMQTAASGAARFDYDPATLTAKGLLLEEARTNKILYSDLSSGWAGSNGATLSVAPTSILGISTHRITSVAGVYGGIMRSSVTNTTGTHTMSVYLRKVDWPYVGFRIGNAAINSGLIPYIDLDTLVTNTNGVAGTTLTTQSMGGGIVRLSLTWTGGVGTLIDIVLTTSLGNESGPGSIKNLDVAGVQVELGSFPTSYIPTTSAAATRSADSLSIPTGSWYNQNAGTFVNDVSWISSSGTNYPMFFRVDDGSGNNRWNLYFTQSNTRLAIDSFFGGVGQGYFYIASSNTGSAKTAAAQSLNSANASFNGVLNTLDTAWTPISATRLYLDGSSADKWHQHLKYYPLRVSDTQLQLLTQ